MVTKYTWPNFHGSDYDGVKVIILSYFILRYKLVTKYTWPNFRGSDYDGVKVIIQEMGIEHDVEYGKSRIFIRSPQTLFALEEAREKFIPPLVMFLQRVSYKLYHMVFCLGVI